MSIMGGVQIRLARRFRKQQEFTAGYSPLYSRLFGILADWLAVKPGVDPLVDWLVRAGAGRSSFDVPLLLLAGLHRDILTGCAGVQDLIPYFPSAGGTRAIQEGDISDCLRRAIQERQDELAVFLSTATVQTNETARGLCWLLPVLYPGWESIRLVDLGASAGLNLVADQLLYRLTEKATGQSLVELGCGAPVQFAVTCEGTINLPSRKVLPAIRSRLGCDLAPFVLQSTQDEQTLAAFVWGDQPERLTMLCQGIAALHRVNRTQVPVQLYQADLPDHLPRFLEEVISPRADVPVVLYNTYLTTYLHDKGASLRSLLGAWAARQQHPVLWLQWETLWRGPKPPDLGWVGWTADLWQDGFHHQWHLAWAHPHGTRIQWLPESIAWAAFWRNDRR